MEEKSPEQFKKNNDFAALLERAKQGDKVALESILLLFDDDISYLAKFLRMPYEDAKSSISLEFIETLIRLS